MITALNITGPKASTKRYRVAEWYINKTHEYAVYKRPISDLETHRLKVRGWKKSILCKQKSKESWGSNTYTQQSDFKIKTVIREKEGHYIRIKESIQEEDTTIVNIHASSTGASLYIRQMLIAIKGKIDSNTITVGNFNAPLSSVDRTSRK